MGIFSKKILTVKGYGGIIGRENCKLTGLELVKLGSNTMKKGIMKIVLTFLMALCIGVFAGNVSSYKVANAEEANSATEETTEEECELGKEMLGDIFFPVEAVVPEFVDAFFPQSFKEEVHSCVSGIGGITGSVALGIAAIALFKKKH